MLRDLDSRNGTSLAGMPLAGRVPLAATGRFALGEDCQLDYELHGTALVLRAANGLDRGIALIADREGARVDLSHAGLALDVIFQRGRPLLGRGGAAKIVTFNDEPLGDVRVQVIRGDRLTVDGDEIDIG